MIPPNSIFLYFLRSFILKEDTKFCWDLSWGGNIEKVFFCFLVSALFFVVKDNESDEQLSIFSSWEKLKKIKRQRKGIFFSISSSFSFHCLCVSLPFIFFFWLSTSMPCFFLLFKDRTSFRSTFWYRKPPSGYIFSPIETPTATHFLHPQLVLSSFPSSQSVSERILY